MSQQLINHSPDLKRLRDEGYDIEVRSNLLLIKGIPYVNAVREVKMGMLVDSDLSLSGDQTTTPGTHVIYFAGEFPCKQDGSELNKIKHQSIKKALGHGVDVDHSFSSKPADGYKDYYEKITTYTAILASPAQALDPTVTARSYPVIEPDEGESVFNYIDTATSRAEINMVSQKLEIESVAIVGLGGTGSYVLDLVSKTPVKAIHLFDGDDFLQHNAFRSPGAASLDDLRSKTSKVVHLKNLYSRMRKNIVDHEVYIDETNVNELQQMNFVFLCLDRGEPKQRIVSALEEAGISFVDVGMGVELVNESLLGVLRVTSSTPTKRNHVRDSQRIPFVDAEGEGIYTRNIQLADLNALNAALAVIKWKKLFGFYHDLDNEHFSTYTIDGNALINEDKL